MDQTSSEYRMQASLLALAPGYSEQIGLDSICQCLWFLVNIEESGDIASLGFGKGEGDLDAYRLLRLLGRIGRRNEHVLWESSRLRRSLEAYCGSRSNPEIVLILVNDLLRRDVDQRLNFLL